MVRGKLTGLAGFAACLGVMGCESVVTGSNHSVFIFNNPSGSTITIAPAREEAATPADTPVRSPQPQPQPQPQIDSPIEVRPLGKDEPLSWHSDPEGAPLQMAVPLDTGIRFVASTTILDQAAHPALDALGFALGAPSLRDQRFAILARVEQGEAAGFGVDPPQGSLAQRRALAIREALIAEYAVEAARLVARAWNSPEPWADAQGDAPSHVAIARIVET